MLIGFLLSPQAATGLPEIAIKEVGSGYRADVGTFEADFGEAVHAEIVRQADGLCAGKEIKWGKFGSLTDLGKKPGATPPKISGYYQEFSCSVTERRTFPPAPADWQPTEDDETDVRHVFETYYGRRDTGDFDAAFQMFQPGILGDRPDWSRQMAAANNKCGDGKRRITGVTWYVNPTGANHPGVYAALDFIGDYPTAHYYCGYLILYRRGPGSYEITREEQNSFMKVDGEADPSQLPQMRATACRGN